MRWPKVLHTIHFKNVHHILLAMKLSQAKQMALGDWLLLVACLTLLASL